MVWRSALQQSRSKIGRIVVSHSNNAGTDVAVPTGWKRCLYPMFNDIDVMVSFILYTKLAHAHIFYIQKCYWKSIFGWLYLKFFDFFSEVKIISGKKITLYWDDYQGHLPDIEYNYREGSATILPTTHSGDSGPKSSMHHDESSLHETGLRLWFEGLIRRSEWAPHMRVTCSRHICSRHCRRTVIRTAFPPYPHPTPTQPQPWNHGPWLEPAGRYKSWGAKALSPICESRVARQICWSLTSEDISLGETDAQLAVVWLYRRLWFHLPSPPIVQNMCIWLCFPCLSVWSWWWVSVWYHGIFKYIT